MNLTVHPASSDRFDDVAAALGPKNDGAQACWCLAYRLSSAENNALSGNARPQRLRELCDRQIAPGVVAYVDGAPAGWCAIGPRSDFVRLTRSKTIQVLDATPVWSIVCLVVVPAHRRKGVARALIQGAVEYAATQGAVCVEAYPFDSDGERVSAALAFTGTTAMFQSAGFVFCAATQAKSAGRPRVIMRLQVANPPSHGASGA